MTLPTFASIFSCSIHLSTYGVLFLASGTEYVRELFQDFGTANYSLLGEAFLCRPGPMNNPDGIQWLATEDTIDGMWEIFDR